MERVELLAAHAVAGTALELRVARLIAWFKRRDLLPFGYASYRAFAAAHVDWADSWMRALVRLVESPLERVKAATCHGYLPLRVAVLAPGQTDVDGETEWIRSLQRAKRLVQSLDALPDTAAAVACGEITLDDARKIASVATEDTEEEWLKTSQWFTEPDFSRIVELASRGVPILGIAAHVIDTLIDSLGLQDKVTFSGLERQMPAPRHGSVHPDLPEAAAWYLDGEGGAVSVRA